MIKNIIFISILLLGLQTVKAQNNKAIISVGLQNSTMQISTPREAWLNSFGFALEYKQSFKPQSAMYWGMRLSSINFNGYEPVDLRMHLERWHSFSIWELSPQLSYHIFNKSPKGYLSINLNPSARLRNHVGLDTIYYDGAIQGNPVFAFQNFHEQKIDVGASFEIEPHLYLSPKIDLGIGFSAGLYTNRVKTMFNSRLALYYNL